MIDETMSAIYEYLKVFNNTLSDYNLKEHRVVLCNSYASEKCGKPDVKVGNEALCTAFLHRDSIDEGFHDPEHFSKPLMAEALFWTVG